MLRKFSASCTVCHSELLFPAGPIEYLPCKHYVCHMCLLQMVALSLISPKFMPLRCWTTAAGEIDTKVLQRIVIDPQINVLWDKYRILRKSNEWTCPVGHPPLGGSLPITTDTVPIWKQPVECSGCLTSTFKPIRKDLECIPGCHRTRYCLLCSGEIDLEEWECASCGHDQVVGAFFTALLEANVLSHTWVTQAIRQAKLTEVKMRGGKDLTYQTLGEMEYPLLLERTALDGLTSLMEEKYPQYNRHHDFTGPPLEPSSQYSSAMHSNNPVYKDEQDYHSDDSEGEYSANCHYCDGPIYGSKRLKKGYPDQW